MNRTKLKTKVYLTLVLGLLFLSIASVASAWGPRSGVTYRPISDWVENNPRVIYGFTTSWDLLPEGYILRPEIDDPDQYSGYIKEKVLDDGRAELTVVVFGKGCPIRLFGLADAFSGIMEDIMVDTSYYCVCIDKFILPEPGMEIPFFFDILFGGMGEMISSYSIGFGSGIFTDYAETFGFTSGEAGRVFLHMESYIDEEGNEIWPHETIEIYQI
jgi:hypothetical protein